MASLLATDPAAFVTTPAEDILPSTAISVLFCALYVGCTIVMKCCDGPVPAPRADLMRQIRDPKPRVSTDTDGHWHPGDDRIASQSALHCCNGSTGSRAPDMPAAPGCTRCRSCDRAHHTGA